MPKKLSHNAKSYLNIIKLHDSVVQSYEQGFPLSTIARRLNISRDALRQYVKERNLKRIKSQFRHVVREDLSGLTFGRLTVKQMADIALFHRTQFMCLCDCGNVTTVEGSKLRNGHTKSCGCLSSETITQRNKRNQLPDGVALKNRVISSYKNRAKINNLEFTLSNDDMNVLLSSNCFYCGGTPSRITTHPKHPGSFIYNGIDRFDNKLGYITGNVVTACTECNFKKGAQSGNDFLIWIRKVYQNCNTPGGTGNCVQYAQSQGRKIIAYNPDDNTVVKL